MNSVQPILIWESDCSREWLLLIKYDKHLELAVVIDIIDVNITNHDQIILISVMDHDEESV